MSKKPLLFHIILSIN